MKPFFNTAARALAALTLVALVALSILAIYQADEQHRASTITYALMSYGFWWVGFWAYRRAHTVPAGAAFFIHACSWSLYLPVYALNGGRPEPSVAYALFALGAFLHAPSLLHFAAALSLPRQIARLLPVFAGFYALMLVLWVVNIGG